MEDRIRALLPLSSRRGVFFALLAGMTGVAATAIGIPFFLFLRPSRSSRRVRARFRESDIPPGAGLGLELGPRTLLVVCDEPGRYRAFWGRCPHLGCSVVWDSDRGQIVCPCHGGRFDRSGRVLEGPPETDLEEAAVRFDPLGQGTVVVSEG